MNDNQSGTALSKESENESEPQETFSSLSTGSTRFQPKIVGFLCNWCSYAGADLAGVSRFQYAPNIRIIRVMCSGRVDPAIVLEMFIQGADGVFIGGCHLGDCHYQKGNYYAEKRINMTMKLITKAGLETERLRLEWISASEGQIFAEKVTEFTKQIEELGPSSVSGEAPNFEVLENLFIARNVIEDFRLRVLIGKGVGLVDDGNVYNEKIDPEKLDVLINRAIDEEFIRSKILYLIKDQPLSTIQIADKLKVNPDLVLEHIVTLKDRDLLEMKGIEDYAPMYLAKQITTSEDSNEIQISSEEACGGD
jgi:coenzyme F420-reducing hydrogenase delta subunit